MKASIKFAVVGALALIGGVANAANVNVTGDAATGSSLILLLKNATDGTFFYSELAPTVNDVRSISQLHADTPQQYSVLGDNIAGPLNVPAALNGYTSANLQAYLSGNTGDAITWTIMGSKDGVDNNNGNKAFVVTSNVDMLNTAIWENGTAGSSATAFNAVFIANTLNGSGVTFNNGVSTTNGWGDANFGQSAPVSFNGIGYENGTSLGGAQSLYLLSTTGGEAANVYKSQYTLTLSSAGLLSYDAPTSTVPVPAAIWLLGSGLMGLVGIGRRRNTAVAA